MDIPTIDRRKLTLVAGGLIGTLILLVSLTAYIASIKPGGQQAKQEQGARTAETTTPVEPPPPLLPKVYISTWDVHLAPQLVPASSSQLYAFKSVVPAKYAALLSQKIMGTNKVTKGKKGLFIATLESPDRNDLSAFIYNAGKGEFSYASTRGIILPGSKEQPVVERVSALVNAVFLDPTLKVTASYKRKDKPGVTFYEVHRDWAAVGLPIINPVGLLNVAPSKSLKTLSLLGGEDNSKDTNIYATTDNSDQKARATDFNTFTAGINDKDSTVATIVSNIRELERTQLKVAAIIPYDQALAKLKNNSYTILYTAPAGQGTPNFDKVFPDNKAVAKLATVEDSTIAYLEDSPQTSQQALIPNYIFRGTAQLTSGYLVNFIAAVPALSPLSSKTVLGVSTQRSGSQSQATFSITSAPSAGHCGTALTCPPSPSPQPPSVLATPAPTSPPIPTSTPAPSIDHCGTGLTCPPSPAPTQGPTPTCGQLGTCPPTPIPHCGSGLTCPPSPSPQPPQPTQPPLFATSIPQPTVAPTPTCGQLGTCPPTPTPHCGQLGTCPPTPVPTGCRGSQCQGTYEITGQPLPTAAPEPTAEPEPTVTPPPPAICLPSVADLGNKRSVSGILSIGQLTQATYNRMHSSDNSAAVKQWESLHWGESINVGNWYAYSNNGSSFTADDIISSWKSLGYTCTSYTSGGKGDCRSTDRVLEELTAEPDCPIRITGGSPTIFAYGLPGQVIQISPQSSINYAEPGLVDGGWVVKTEKNGRVQVGGAVKDYLYYEYKPVSFSRPSVGWNIDKENLDAFIKSLANSYALTAKETERLQFEITQAASSISSNTLFVGPIDQQELAAKLPLSLTPPIPLTRLNFYVGEATASVIPPTVTPIVRTSSMILEIGASPVN